MEDYEKGIPRLAAVLADENTSQLRGYFPYAIRVLLYRQNEIGEQVKKLNKLDAADAKFQNGARLKSFKFKGRRGEAKRKLIQQIDLGLSEYC